LKSAGGRDNCGVLLSRRQVVGGPWLTDLFSGWCTANQIVTALLWVLVFFRGSPRSTRRRQISLGLTEYDQPGVQIRGRKKVLPVTRTYFFLSLFFQ
jgi:hypothetical protein